jgi:hypothetical protein
MTMKEWMKEMKERNKVRGFSLGIVACLTGASG